MMNPNSTRSMLQGLVGVYLLYLAYQLLRGLIDGIETTMPRWVAILAIAAFAGIGITFLIHAWKVWKRGRTDQDQDPVKLEEENRETDHGKGDSRE